jgi:hypothetical protein
LITGKIANSNIDDIRMAARIKIVDDPLSGLLSSIPDEPKLKIAEATTSATNDEADVSFKVPDKVKFIEKKAKQEPRVAAVSATETYNEVVIVPTATSTHSGIAVSAGLGFNVDLWTNNDKLSSKADAGNLLDDLVTTNKGENAGMFTSDAPAARQRVAAPSTTASTSTSGNVRLTSVDDDDNISSLKVSKLLERENDLSFDVYGKSKQVEAVVPKSAYFSSEDLDISNLEKISKLETDIKTDRAIGGSKSKAKLTEPAADAGLGSADIDLDTLNLDDYIAQQSNTSASLFD